MRVSQLWHWIYHRGAREFGGIRNIARSLLDKLVERCTLARPTIVAKQVSADGTRKWLLRMLAARARDRNAEIECVADRRARAVGRGRARGVERRLHGHGPAAL
jgi:23S rRNA (adenine2503-C2)-methyltransferase